MSKSQLPLVDQALACCAPLAREAMGDDFWSYGVAASARTLETFVRAHYEQGLSSRHVPVSELFHPATYETYSI